MSTAIRLAPFNVQHVHSADPEDDGPGVCATCEDDLNGECVKLHRTAGPEHVQCAIDRLRRGSLDDAWREIALHVAKNPGKHDVATIRAVIHNLLAMTGADS